jgi:hypothetical protein
MNWKTAGALSAKEGPQIRFYGFKRTKKCKIFLKIDSTLVTSAWELVDYRIKLVTDGSSKFQF